MTRPAWILLCLILLAAPPVPAADVMVVYDASNSMWGQIEGRHKIEIAREVMASVMAEWDEATQVGLVAYGHRREADCEDIETVIEVGPLDRSQFIETVNAIVPRGKTPLTAAVRHAADVLDFRDRPATVILISDGIESCNADPCASAAELERAGIGFTAHVIGFDVADEADQAGLKCIADQTGGQFFAAADADGLAEALGETSRLVAQPDPDVAVPEVSLLAPESADVGSEVEIGWQGEVGDRDLITVVAPDSPDEELGRYARIGSNERIRLIMPGQPGTWQLRFRHQASGSIAARGDIELVEAAPEISVAESVAAGSPIRIEWLGAVHPRDMIMLVPAGSPEDERGRYLRVGDKREDSLTAPGEPGDYELRYRLNSDGRVLARAGFSVVAREVTLSGPAEVAAGAPFEFEWSESIHPRDYISIAPAGAPDDTSGTYTRARDRNRDRLTAPGEPGDYELRYRLHEDGRVVARHPFSVVAEGVTLTVAEEVTAGAQFEFEWSGSIHPRDYIMIVPAGAPDDARGSYTRARDRTRDSLTAPGEAGDYELRYRLHADDRIVARAALRVVATEVTLSAPDEAVAGSDITVSWNARVHPRDYVTVVPVGTPDDQTAGYSRVRDDSRTTLRMPGEAGEYELRYILQADQQVMARHSISLLAPEVTLRAPDRVPAGERLVVHYEPAIHPRDYITIVPSGAPDDAYESYQRARDRNETTLAAPEAPGNYEIRYLLQVNDRAIARRPLVVE